MKKKGDECWEERFNELKEYKKTHGHCDVPTKYRKTPLGRWVSTQRSMYKKFNKGEQSSCGSSDDVIQNRIAQLNTLGFHWSLLPDRVMFAKKA